MTVVSIHQPNFFPWIGFFHKALNSDIFVLLDDVQYPRIGKKNNNSIVNTACVSAGGDIIKMRVPLMKAPLNTKIKDMRILSTDNFRDKFSSDLVDYCSRVSNAGAADDIESFVCFDAKNLADLNYYIIKNIFSALNLKVELVRQSEIGGIMGSRNVLLQQIVTACGGTTYLRGRGAEYYHCDKQFNDFGIVCSVQPNPFEVFRNWKSSVNLSSSIIELFSVLGIDAVREELKNSATKCKNY